MEFDFQIFGVLSLKGDNCAKIVRPNFFCHDHGERRLRAAEEERRPRPCQIIGSGWGNTHSRSRRAEALRSRAQEAKSSGESCEAERKDFRTTGARPRGVHAEPDPDT